jgi:pimeloyl-ACP methyl ester carboxylesterase
MTSSRSSSHWSTKSSSDTGSPEVPGGIRHPVLFERHCNAFRTRFERDSNALCSDDKVFLVASGIAATIALHMSIQRPKRLAGLALAAPLLDAYALQEAVSMSTSIAVSLGLATQGPPLLAKSAILPPNHTLDPATTKEWAYNPLSLRAVPHSLQEALFNLVVGTEYILPEVISRHFNAISTPFQRHFNAISTPFQRDNNSILTRF